MSEADNKTVALVSLGCPKNLVDSEWMMGELAQAGYVVGADMSQADIILINTCGFIESARDEALGVIEQALECKALREGVKVFVAGCMVQRDAEKLFEYAPGLDGIFGVNNRGDILKVLTGQSRCLVEPFKNDIYSDSGRFRLTAPHVAYLRIAEGCSHRCTFCTIPDIRGPFRSKTMDMVLSEARELADDGVQELNIIAQDTTCYGEDLENTDLPKLLRELDKIDSIQWIRLLYTYPRKFTDELIEAMVECKKVVPYVDIPLQHISDSVLKRMGRGVTGEEVETLVAKLQKAGISVRTTFIVGFPGETNGDFEELMKFVENFRFAAMGVFEYSAEEGTPAAKLPARVSDEVSAERFDRLMSLQQQIVFEHNCEMIGSEFEVLVDGICAEGYCVGRSEFQAPDIDGVCILSEICDPGEFVKVKVADIDQYDLIVEPLNS